MIWKALKWMFFLWLLTVTLPPAASWVSRWAASRPTPAEARISELAEEIEAGELTADDLEIAELREVEGAEPAAPVPPEQPSPTTLEDMLETFTQATSAAIVPAADPTTPTDVATAKARAESAIAELDVLFGEWIAALEAVQEAHTDVWERRWAGDSVTNARGDRLRWIRDFRLRMTSSLASTGTLYSEWLKYELTANSANFNQGLIRDVIALAGKTLAAMQAPNPDAGSQRPTDEPTDVDS